MRDVILTLLVFGAVPYMLVRPSIGVLVWSWLGYMNPHRATWGFAYAFPFVQVSAIATALGLLFSREKLRFPWSGTTVVWVLWTMWFSLTTVLAVNHTLAYPGWEREIKVQAMVLATLLVMHSRERLHQLVWVIVVSIGFFGVKGGLFTVAHGGKYIVWGPPSSFIEGNNELALALLTIVPLMRYLQTQAVNKWVKHGLAASMALCAFSIVGSYSRGALLGAVAMGFILWLKSRRKIVLSVPIVLLAIAAVEFMPERWFERMHTIHSYEQDPSALGRINAWTYAINFAFDHPITGGGFNAFTPDMFQRYAPNPQDFHDAHSIYFQVLAEHGFVGLVLFLLLGFLTVATASWIIRNTRDHAELAWAAELAKMIQVALAGFAVGGGFLGLAYWDLPYHLMAIVVLTKAVVRGALASPVATAGVVPASRQVVPKVSPGVPAS